MDVSYGIAAEQGLLRQAVALSLVKQAAQIDRAMAGILEQAVDTVPVSTIRGAQIDIAA